MSKPYNNNNNNNNNNNVQALGGDLETAWRLSFSDESTLEVSVTQYTLYKSTSYLTLAVWHHLHRQLVTTPEAISSYIKRHVPGGGLVALSTMASCSRSSLTDNAVLDA